MRLRFQSPSIGCVAAAGLAGLLFAAAHASEPGLNSQTKVDFTRHIRPILAEHCFACHGPDEKTRKAGLRLDLRTEATKRLRSGAAAVVPGNVGESELIHRITTEDEDDRMPPPKGGKYLAADQIDLLRRWVQEGADYPEHWAYVKPERPALPAVKLQEWPRNPIDYFVLSRLEGEGLQPSPEASREILIRRVCLDLTGLPPSVQDVAQFVRDNRPDAYERLVDRLLGSPHYGERWARPWLDQARYADSNGYEADFRRSIWPYRDWVIAAFNQDLPFNQFTIEQLAGDLLPNPTLEQKIATGFHRNTMVNTEGGTDEEEFRIAAVVDRVNTTFGVWMGTTMACAQCHSHKYDPFTHRDYYQAAAFFNQTRDKGRSNEPELELPTPEQQAKRDEIRARIEPLQKRLNTPTSDLDQAQAIWQADAEAARDSIERGWTTLWGERLHGSDGVILTHLDDGSIRSTGSLPDTSTYEITATATLSGITAVRVEALADDELPNRGSGRSDEGDFVLTELTVQAFPSGAPGGQTAERPQLGVWRALGPFRAETVRESFTREFISPAKIDTAQSFEDGKLQWQERADWHDGAVHSLQAARSDETGTINHDNTAIYLLRKITVANARPLRIALGSDDGLQVWLNGRKILSREVERTAAPDQDMVELQLAAGENQLLLKINNGLGESGFYFSLLEDPASLNRVLFDTAYASFSMDKYDVKEAIDGKPQTGWSIAAHEPANRVDQQAIFVAKQPFGFPEGTRLVLRLQQQSERRQHLLGRFRLSLSTAPQGSHRTWAAVPNHIRSLLTIPPEERNQAHEDQLAAYYRSTDLQLDPVRAQIAELRKAEPKDVAITLVMEAAAEPRPTHVLIRGSHLSPGEEVLPGTPAVLHPWPAGEPTNRLGFARWLVHPDNPLVGRVTMNRIWAQYFGRGLVETSEEFGVQGDLPAHPELLDWLATEFIRQGWSLKAMHKRIVSSATYRQQSAVSPGLLERDPSNRLLARGPRFRMEAEMLRDHALAASGLLNEKIGGPSVFPYQPEGVWNSPYNGDRWLLSKDGDQFRRGIYTFWRRTAPYASFAAFDAPSREVMCERRLPSNTPIQALVTLNDPAFLAAAAGLARRVLATEASTPRDRMMFAFEACLARKPAANELAPLLRLYEKSLSQFRRDPAAAQALASIGFSGEIPEKQLAELAAWTVIGNVLFNLDETLTKG